MSPRAVSGDGQVRSHGDFRSVDGRFVRVRFGVAATTDLRVRGIFSGSLWWWADNRDVAAQRASRIAHRKVRAAAKKPALHLWFEVGTNDETADRDGNGVIHAIQDTRERMDELVAKGFRPGADTTYREVAGGEHNDATLARVVPEFLRWARPPARG